MTYQVERRSPEGTPQESNAGGRDDIEKVSEAGAPIKADADSVPTFLATLFNPELVEGFIEVRLFPDNGKGAPVVRMWYETPSELLEDLPRLKQIAERETAGVFFGVLPRTGRGVGKNEHTRPGVVVWGDLDFHDFEGGEAEARAMLAKFPVPPTLVVRSGRGLHVYWLLREAAAPEVLSGLAKRIAAAVGGDHVHDAARVMRLPGSVHRKDPTDPLPVEIESMDLERVFNASEIEEALELVELYQDPRPAEQPGTRSDAAAPAGLSDRVRALFIKHKRLAGLFAGEGKLEFDENGKRLDTSGSGYDFSLVMALAKAGIRDKSELAGALWARPGSADRDIDARYVKRTVDRALELIEAAEEEVATLSLNFEVEKARIFDSDPARYELTINGKAVTFTSAGLRSMAQFSNRFMDALHFIPALPEKSEEWAIIVNGWLQQAEVVTIGPEGDVEQVLREAVDRIVNDLAEGSDPADLNRGLALPLEGGGVGFKAEAVLKRLQEEGFDADRSDVCRVLRDLEFTNGPTRIGGTPVRVWRRLA